MIFDKINCFECKKDLMKLNTYYYSISRSGMFSNTIEKNPPVSRQIVSVLMSEHKHICEDCWKIVAPGHYQ
jgi:hypothetical protein